MLDLLSARVEEKKLSVIVDYPVEVPYRFIGDEGRIRQIIVNLLGNAIKFTERGEIIVRVEPVPATAPDVVRVRVSVEDTGLGIEPEGLAKLFESFTQADGSTTRRFGGTGLGLPISKRLVELMGGEIGASSTPGVGSKFWFELGLALDDSPSMDPPSDVSYRELRDSAPCQTFKGTSVLVAEDNPVNQKVATRMLERLGCRVDVACDGLEAIDMSSKFAYSAIFMDCQMPELDGLEATRIIREQEGAGGRARTPIIAMTASAMSGDREECLAAGMDDYETKPIRAQKIEQLLQLWVSPSLSGVPSR